jgi:hypothetical protein
MYVRRNETNFRMLSKTCPSRKSYHCRPRPGRGRKAARLGLRPDGETSSSERGSTARADLHRPHHGACYIAEALKRPRHRSPTSRRLLRRSRLIIGSSRECRERTSSTQSPLLSVPPSLSSVKHCRSRTRADAIERRRPDCVAGVRGLELGNVCFL